MQLQSNQPEMDTGIDTADTAPTMSAPVLNKGLQVGTSEFFEYVKKGLAGAESSNNYFAEAPNSSAHGKYQFLDATRDSIMPGIGRQTFLTTPELQEEAMNKLLQQNLDFAKNKGADLSSMAADDAAGMLWAMHLKGAAEGYRIASDPTFAGKPDPNGTTPRLYFNKGKSLFRKAAGIETPDNSLEPDAQAGMFKSQGNRDMATRMAGVAQPELFSDYFSKVIDGAKQGTTMGQATTAYESLNAALDKINKVAKTEYKLEDVVPHYIGQSLTAYTFGPQFDGVSEKFNSLLSTIKSNNPDIKLPYKSFEDVKPDILNRTRNYEMSAAEANTDSGWLTRIMGFGAEMGTYMFSGLPETAATAVGTVLPISRAGILAKAVTGAAGAAAITAPTQMLVQSNAAKIGDEEAGFAKGAENVAMAAGGTGLLVAGIEAAKGLLPVYARAAANAASKVFTKTGAEDLAAAAEKAGIHDAEIQGLPKLHENNPSGEGLEGLSDLATRQQKAEMDLAHDNPVSVVPETAVVPRVKLDYTETQTALKDILSEIGGPRSEMAKLDLPTLKMMQEEAATVTPEQYAKSMKLPTEPVVSPGQRIMQRLNADVEEARTNYDFNKEVSSYSTKLDEHVKSFDENYREDLVNDPTRTITTLDREGNEVEIPLANFKREVTEGNLFLKTLRACITGA